MPLDERRRLCEVGRVAVSYEEFLAFADALTVNGRVDEAEAVRSAVVGGATGGEILTNLGSVLSQLLAEAADRQDTLGTEAARLLALVDRALRDVGQRPPAFWSSYS
jgi:hypothetical protein